MIYTPMVNRALRLAYRAHAGQLDRGGVPYIFHPYHLAEQMDDERSICVALLHDVVEDSPVTLEEIQREFPSEIAEAVALLTHDPSTDYFAYVRRLKANPLARKVKLADLMHNADQTRCAGAGIDPVKLQHWREKYRRAQEILMEV
mgnify:FL=1